MVKPLYFATKDGLVHELEARKATLAQWFDRRYSSMDQIADTSADGATVRAFHRMPESPSKVLRSWAHESLNNRQTIGDILNIGSEEEYDRWIEDFSASLSTYWAQRMGAGREMRYGPGRKITNALMKTFVLWDGLEDEQRSRLISFLHVPWDSFSLVTVRNAIVASPYANSIGRITKSASMGSVTNKVMYDGLRALARDIAKEAAVPPIYLDVLAWDVPHSIQP